MYIAHSAKYGVPEQNYGNHITGVYDKVCKILQTLSPHLSKSNYDLLSAIVKQAAIYHDMGKLCDNCQSVLSGKIISQKMPNHVDAGTAYLLSLNREDSKLAAWIIFAHHQGYKSALHDNFRDTKILAERCPYLPNAHLKMCEYTDLNLQLILARHNQSVNLPIFNVDTKAYSVSMVLMRLALSILVEADHYDTAKNYKNLTIEDDLELRPADRLAKLDSYVAKLQSVTHSHPKIESRKSMKQKIYDACRYSSVDSSITYCASGVGTGKTTAVMAYALSRANKCNLNKIIYVAPFINLISQTVEVFRNSLVLPGENDVLVVAENHHQFDFDKNILDPNYDSELSTIAKLYTTNWNSPIICTTAVQFFETLGASRCGKLKKFHHIAGSVVIIDESHSCIPDNLWPITLKWVEFITKHLNCKVIFVSGSLTKPWEIKEFRKLSGFSSDVPSIIPTEISEETLKLENNRVAIKYIDKKLHLIDCDWFLGFKGSKIIVCNTIVNAARIAKYLSHIKGQSYVEHLSTALTPEDREETIERVKRRLKSNPDEDWVLVATSCVEVGMDFSFQHGFHENNGMMGAVQLSGRVNRNNEFANAELWVFELVVDPNTGCFTKNSEFNDAVGLFKQFYKAGTVGPQYCERILQELVNQGTALEVSTNCADRKEKISTEKLIEYENKKNPRAVDDYYNVITDDKITVIIDATILKGIPSKYPTKTELVRKSVQIYTSKLDKIEYNKFIKPSSLDGIYIWNGNYDKFLGYMAHFI